MVFGGPKTDLIPQETLTNAGADDGHGKLLFEDGARGGGRTRMALRPRDFKSLASTNFTTRANAWLVGLLYPD